METQGMGIGCLNTSGSISGAPGYYLGPQYTVSNRVGLYLLELVGCGGTKCLDTDTNWTTSGLTLGLKVSII